MKRWGERFLSSTRGQVVKLLRRTEATVNELAAALDLTDNAVRAHLTTLERDGLVRQAGKRAGVRKPEAVYALTSEAEQLFPKAYHLLLNRLLDVLAERLSPAEIEEVLREVGRALATGASAPTEQGDLRHQLVRALEVVKSLGGLAEVAEGNDRRIVGFSCPLGAVAREHPEICRLVEALLTEVIGVPVKEQCERSDTPRCVFHIEQASP